MSRTFRPRAAIAAVVLSFVSVLAMSPAAFADPWHKFAKQDAYWHHGSGWVFPRDVGAFKLRGSPTQLDGNDDVSGEYVMERNGVRSTAFVDVYYPSSAAAGANLDTARASVLSKASQAKCQPSQSEKKIALDKHPDIDGKKLVFKPKSTGQCAQATLYFFRTPRWVITVRADDLPPDGSADEALDEFVRALRWDTLDTDPFDHDTSP